MSKTASQNSKTYLFEQMPVPGAVMQLSLPIVISSLVTILYNLADTFFVGMLGDPVQNAAVTLVYPVTLAFNAVNNLFGVGVSSAMSRHLGISQKLYMIPMQVSLGFSQGIMPLVSYNYASGNRTRMKRAILFALRIIVCSMLLLSVVYFLLAPAMIRAFLDSGEIVEYGSRFLRVMCLGFAFLCTDFLAVGVFQALGMGRNALVFAICRKLVLEIPLLFVLNHLYPLYGLPFALLITEVFLSCMGILMLRRIMQDHNL